MFRIASQSVSVHDENDTILNDFDDIKQGVFIMIATPIYVKHFKHNIPSTAEPITWIKRETTSKSKKLWKRKRCRASESTDLDSTYHSWKYGYMTVEFDDKSR